MTEPEQLALVASTVRTARVRTEPGPAEVDPVARVCVDVALPHLDRPFDYLVPAPMAATAVPGTRVRVRFSGKLVDGWVLQRVAASGHTGRIERVAKVVSADPVLAPEVADLARVVADRWAGTLADVLRAAVPPRHAAAEAAVDALGTPDRPLVAPLAPDDAGPWAAYSGGAALVRRVGDRSRRVHGRQARTARGVDGRAGVRPRAGDRPPGGRGRGRGSRRRGRGAGRT